MVWSLAAECRISPHNNVQDSNAPTNEIIKPIETKAAPHLPTTCSRTYAIDGFFRAASSGCFITPSDSTFTNTNSANTPKKLSTVALPTSLRFSARAEYTLAPSIPINTHTVTNIMLLTWFVTLPRLGFVVPQKSLVKISALNARPTNTIKVNNGTTLAIVVIKLINAASLIPRSTKKWVSHNKIEAQRMAGSVLPSPNTGKK